MISRTAILATILVVMAVLSICSASSNKVGVVVPLGASTQPRSGYSRCSIMNGGGCTEHHYRRAALSLGRRWSDLSS